MARYCYEKSGCMQRCGIMNTGKDTRDAGNICIRFNSPASWISAHLNAFGYFDGIVPIFQMEFIIGL